LRTNLQGLKCKILIENISQRMYLPIDRTF
jgi:hypothetical protein